MSQKVWEWLSRRLPQTSLRTVWMLVTAAHSDSKWSIAARAKMRRFFLHCVLVGFHKMMVNVVRILDVVSLSFLNVGICHRCMVPSSSIHGLAFSVPPCGLGVVVTGLVLLFQECSWRKSRHGVWYLAVLGCHWWQWNEVGQIELTSPGHIPVPSLRLDANTQLFDLGLAKIYEAYTGNLTSLLF